jgi:hypothetical protein
MVDVVTPNHCGKYMNLVFINKYEMHIQFIWQCQKCGKIGGTELQI